MVITQHAVHDDCRRVDRAFLFGLAKSGLKHRLMTVPSTTRRPPDSAMTAPPAALLQQHREVPVVVRSGKQKPGRAVPAPVPMAAAAPGPAVPIVHRHLSRG